MGIPEVLGLAGLMVAQFSLIWYKLGALERAFNNHCREAHQKKEV